MGQSKQDTLLEAQTAFVDHLKWLRQKAPVLRGEPVLSQMALADETERGGMKVSQGTISNIETFDGDSGFSNFAALAAHFGVPLWVMLIPGLDTDLLEGERLKRFVKLVENYVTCGDAERVFIENMAAGYAGLARKK